MKILAIASAGGHWVQLLRLKPAFEDHELVFLSTRASFSETVKGYDYYTVPDASRWNKLKLIYMGFCVAKRILLLKPDMIVTTGAAPGLMGIVTGKVFGIKTIWIDSIANVEKISLSGKLAILFADKVYTQWSHLVNEDVEYNGKILL